jgi:hypothetical protein
MGFSGKFVRDTTVTTNRPARENWGTGVDPRHSQGAMGSDQGFPALKNVPSPVVPGVVVDSYDPSGTNANPNMLAPEREPRGHEGVGTPPHSADKYAEIRSDTRRHLDNLGATLKNTAHMTMRSFTQTFASPRVESLPVSTDDGSASATGAARRALRGFNSLAANNPGSPTVNYSGNYIRQGMELYRWTNRRMPRRTPKHTQRPIYLNVASTAHVTTAPLGVNYSPNGSPYPSVASMQTGTQRPMVRREPRIWDENARTDGTEQGAEQYLNWEF